MAQTPDHIAAAFRIAREQAGLTKAEVSRRLSDYGLKVSASTVTKWESGERGISLDAAMRLCDVLGVNWADLYSPAENLEVHPVTLELQSLSLSISIGIGLNFADASLHGLPEQIEKMAADETHDLDSGVRDDMKRLSRLVADLSDKATALDEQVEETQELITSITGRLDGSA